MPRSSTEQLYYRPTWQKAWLLAAAAVIVFVPALFVDALEFTVWVFLLVILIGLPVGIRQGYPSQVPTWLTFDLIGGFLAIYAAWTVGTILPLWAVILGATVFVLYDLAAVHLSDHMEAMTTAAFVRGYPAAIIVPHTRLFSFSALLKTLRERGLDGLHGNPETECTLLGIGDLAIPGALACAAAAASTTRYGGPTVALPVGGVAVAAGATLALGWLFVFEPQRRLAALTVGVPGAMIGLAVSLVAGWVSRPALWPF
jgi:presenilin-like A22 family membrane protease